VDLQSQNSTPPGFEVVGESSSTKGTVSRSSWEGDNSRVNEFNGSNFLKNNSENFSSKNHFFEKFF
jgi:hypothetical protein